MHKTKPVASRATQHPTARNGETVNKGGPKCGTRRKILKTDRRFLRPSGLKIKFPETLCDKMATVREIRIANLESTGKEEPGVEKRARLVPPLLTEQTRNLKGIHLSIKRRSIEMVATRHRFQKRSLLRDLAGVRGR